MPATNPRPLTAAEKTAASRARKRAAQAMLENLDNDERMVVLKVTDMQLIRNMLATRIDLAGNADARAEYRDLDTRIARQMGH